MGGKPPTPIHRKILPSLPSLSIRAVLSPRFSLPLLASPPLPYAPLSHFTPLRNCPHPPPLFPPRSPQLLSASDVEAGAAELLRQGCKAVLIKGGHATEKDAHSTALAQDYYADGQTAAWLSLPRLQSAQTHGTVPRSPLPPLEDQPRRRHAPLGGMYPRGLEA